MLPFTQHSDTLEPRPGWEWGFQLKYVDNIRRDKGRKRVNNTITTKKLPADFKKNQIQTEEVKNIAIENVKPQ